MGQILKLGTLFCALLLETSFAAPSVVDQQVAIALKQLPESLSLCSKTLASASRLKESTIGKPVDVLRIVDSSRSWAYVFKDSRWEVSKDSYTGRVLNFPGELLAGERRYPRSLSSQLAASIRDLAKLLAKEEGIEGGEELGLCLEGGVLKNTEIITAGYGETNIALVTLQVASVKWPSFPRIVITDGANIWDLTSHLAQIKSPIGVPVGKVLGVRGMEIARTQLSQHVLSNERSFLLPIVQWQVSTKDGQPSTFFPDEYIRIHFEKSWDPKTKTSLILEESITFEHLSTSYTGPGPIEEQPAEEQLKFLKKKANVFGF